MPVSKLLIRSALFSSSILSNGRVRFRWEGKGADGGGGRGVHPNRRSWGFRALSFFALSNLGNGRESEGGGEGGGGGFFPTGRRQAHVVQRLIVCVCVCVRVRA